ncbi:MAG: DnaD domain protein [Lachnospiraceae bacterium]|nr:DnaD domain protein [Candidatus Equihabitans merdae]
MGTLTLKTSLLHNVTMVSNLFLDRYMPRANGEFVKVYLMLLRTSARHGETLTLSRLADQLDCTEKDICRAIRYWEREGLLLLETDGEGEITGLMLSAPQEALAEQMPVVIDTGHTKAEPAVQPVVENKAVKGGKVSAERMAELNENEEIHAMNVVASQTLGKPLTLTEMRTLLYFYDNLEFSPDLIAFLLEYCVNNGKKRFSYIEKVAHAWYEDGVRTVEDAKSRISNFSHYYKIMDALKIKGRDPSDKEITFMKRWVNTYDLPIEIILEGCSRALMRKSQNRSIESYYAYADSILSEWHRNGVTTMDDVSRLDEQFKSRLHQKTVEKKAAGKTTSFDEFDQRQYDYDDLEKRWLKGANV